MKENYDKFEEGLKEYQKRLKKYTYRDNSAGGKIVFECNAHDILEADKFYQKQTGKNPEKQSFIGCSMEELPDEKSLIIEEPDVKKLIKNRDIVPEDFGLIEELAGFDKNLFIETLHNMFSFYKNSRRDLQVLIKNSKNEEQKKLCELALKFFKKYDWAASANLVGVLEDRKP